MKRLSVIIPTYQHAATIAACLDSVLGQSRTPDEVIVVDDGSTDATQDVLAPYRDRVRIVTQENRGSNPARNAGFAASSGDLVIFCDADVVMRPDMLAAFEAALDAHPETSFAYGGFRFGWKAFRSFPYSEERLRRMNYIHTTSLIRRADFPGFDEGIRRLQDWDLWLMMAGHKRQGTFVPGEWFKVTDAHGRVGISRWLPSLAYRIPWKRLGWMPEPVRKFQEAKQVIMKKHGL